MQKKDSNLLTLIMCFLRRISMSLGASFSAFERQLVCATQRKKVWRGGKNPLGNEVGCVCRMKKAE